MLINTVYNSRKLSLLDTVLSNSITHFQTLRVVAMLCVNDGFVRLMDLLLAQASVNRATINRLCSAIYGSIAGFVGGALSDVQLFLQQYFSACL